jgi:hypothetical protein
MQKAFEIIPTDAQLDPKGPATSGLVEIVRRRTVIVRTKNCFGQAVIVAGRIVTSLFLVKDEGMVKITIPTKGKFQAIVAERDESNNLALLMPIGLENKSQERISGFGMDRIYTGPIAGFGEPLIMADSCIGKPRARVMSMSFVLKVCPRKEEEMWKFERDIPSGLLGGGIWKMDGSLVGLSLATKDSLLKSSADYRAHFYALPAEPILEFVE